MSTGLDLVLVDNGPFPELISTKTPTLNFTAKGRTGRYDRILIMGADHIPVFSGFGWVPAQKGVLA